MKLKTIIRLVTMVWLLMLSGKGTAQSVKSIVINEIMASNVGVVISPAYNFDGWIELYNPTEQAISLSGMYLSDDANNLKRWQMPTSIGTVPAKGYLVVWFGSDDIKSNQAPFKLDCDGGTIYLSNASGQYINQVYPKAMSRTAWARKVDGNGEWGWTANPTPGATNATSVFATERLAAPVVNVGSRIFTNTLRISVEIPEGATLRYTTDGSVPTPPGADTQQDDDAESDEPTWTNWVTNSDCEGSDATCFVSYNGDEGQDVNRITSGVGYNNSRGIKVHAINDPQYSWDTQFFIYTPDHVWKTGEQYRFSMRVRADEAARITMQSHNEPHGWICSNMLCNEFYVTSEWQNLTYEGTITSEQAGDAGMNTIAFNLNEANYENNYYFDDIVWESLDASTVNKYEISVRNNPGEVSPTGRFTVSNTTNYVFRLFKDGYLPSVPVTRSYIKTDNKYTIPVVSIVGDDKYYNDPMWGIDVDGINGKTGNNSNGPANWNMAWDRPVNFSFISPTDGMLFNQDVMTSVSGGWSRSTPPRSFKLKSNKVFDGLNHLDYAFFPQKPYIRNKALLVRNGGNDPGCRFMDPAMTTIVQRSGIDLDVQSTLQVAEYINGEFRGILNLRETNNDKFVYANWGYDDEEIDYFENFQFTDGTDEVWKRLMKLSERINDNGVYDEVKKLLDIDEFTNYMATEMYLGNSDWPNNNVKGYRSQKDGRFRFILFDLDQIFNRWCPMNHLSTLDGQFANEQLVVLLRNLLGNDTYRKKFIDTFCIIAGSVFERERVMEMVDEIADNMRPMLQLEGKYPDGTANEIKEKMWTRLDDILGPQGQLEQFQPAQLSGLQRQTVMLSANAPDAHITINGIDVPYADFNGYLFQPVRLEAKAPAGYRFVGWTAGAGAASNCLIATNDTWKYYDQGEAPSNWNTSGFNDNSWASGKAPLGYKMAVNTTVSYGSDASQKNPTTYFRKKVTLSSTPSSNDRFLLNYKIDDGFVVYVNGTEATRFNMGNGNVGFDTFSSDYAGDTPLEGTLELSPSLFKSGNNVIAVEVHNNQSASSDLFWAAELYTTVGAASEGYVSTEPEMDLPADATVSLTANFTKISDEDLMTQGFTPLRINEVSAGNTIYVNEWFKHNDWFEIYNATDTELDVAGLYVSDDEDNPLKYQIPTDGVLNTIIPARGHRIVWADEMDAKTQLHTSFKLKNDDGKIVLLCSSDDFVANNKAYFNKHPEMKEFADGIIYSAHNGDQSVGRYPDGGKSFYQMNRPTIERTNILTSADSYLGEDTGLTDINNGEFRLALAEGWNWISHPMVEPIAVTKLSEYADRIVGKDKEAIRDSKLGMTGALKELETGNLYKVKMRLDDTYTCKDFFCEDGRPIMLLPGWNWIGYTVNGQQSLSDALADNMTEEGDMIIGQNGIATYHENGGWQGTLSTLETGLGYMFYTMQAKTLTFKSPSTKVNLSRLHHRTSQAARTRSAFSFRPVSKYAYPNVMGVITEVQKDGEKVAADRFTLYAYDADGECRGEGNWVNGLAWMTLYGKGGETLSYRAVDLMDGNVYSIRETTSFVEGITGRVNQPIVLTLGEVEGNVALIESVPVDPASSEIDGYYNLNGTRVSFRTAGRGIYLVKYKDGSYRKVIVK
ncbi:MAG: CotH kinase family protein [Prevotella sp.]|nr:CotH kinase family protein [Prevotella sp.]